MELTALILGLAGSLHCAFMCSPLAMAVTGGSHKPLLKKVLYNTGRIVTYGLLGAIVALSGVMINLSGLHIAFTMVVGITLIVMGLAGISSIHVPFLTPLLLRFSVILKNLFASYLSRKTLPSVFILGMLNGLLPCGMTYIALTYCITLAGPVDAFNFMMIFGAGTLPVMLGFTSTLTALATQFKFSAKQITRFGFLFLGILVLARLYITSHHAIDHHVSAASIIFCQ